MQKTTPLQRFSDFVDAADMAAWENEEAEAVFHLFAAEQLLETTPERGLVQETEVPQFDLYRFWILWIRYILPTLGEEEIAAAN